jgi:hypothetical protein
MAQSGLLDFVRQSLNKSRGSWPEIAKVTGVGIHKIRKIAQGTHQSPRLDKLEKLERYFRRAA